MTLENGLKVEIREHFSISERFEFLKNHGSGSMEAWLNADLPFRSMLIVGVDTSYCLRSLPQDLEMLPEGGRWVPFDATRILHQNFRFRWDGQSYSDGKRVRRLLCSLCFGDHVKFSFSEFGDRFYLQLNHLNKLGVRGANFVDAFATLKNFSSEWRQVP